MNGVPLPPSSDGSLAPVPGLLPDLGFRIEISVLLRNVPEKNTIRQQVFNRHHGHLSEFNQEKHLPG